MDHDVSPREQLNLVQLCNFCIAESLDSSVDERVEPASLTDYEIVLVKPLFQLSCKDVVVESEEEPIRIAQLELREHLSTEMLVKRQVCRLDLKPLTPVVLCQILDQMGLSRPIQTCDNDPLTLHVDLLDVIKGVITKTTISQCHDVSFLCLYRPTKVLHTYIIP